MPSASTPLCEVLREELDTTCVIIVSDHQVETQGKTGEVKDEELERIRPMRILTEALTKCIQASKNSFLFISRGMARVCCFGYVCPDNTPTPSSLSDVHSGRI